MWSWRLAGTRARATQPASAMEANMCVAVSHVHEAVLDVDGQPGEAAAGQEPRRGDAAQRQPGADDRLTSAQTLLDRIGAHEGHPTGCDDALVVSKLLLESELLHFLPDVAVRLLVERRAAGRVLAERVVLRPHQRGAVAERAADALAVELAVVEELPHPVGLSERRAADADDADPAVADIRGRRLRQELLQVAVPGADDAPGPGSRRWIASVALKCRSTPMSGCSGDS